MYKYIYGQSILESSQKLNKEEVIDSLECPKILMFSRMIYWVYHELKGKNLINFEEIVPVINPAQGIFYILDNQVHVKYFDDGHYFRSCISFFKELNKTAVHSEFPRGVVYYNSHHHVYNVFVGDWYLNDKSIILNIFDAFKFDYNKYNNWLVINRPFFNLYTWDFKEVFTEDKDIPFLSTKNNSDVNFNSNDLSYIVNHGSFIKPIILKGKGDAKNEP